MATEKRNHKEGPKENTMATEKRNLLKGLLITLGVSVATGFLMKWFGAWLSHPFIGTLLALIAVALSILYFGFSGLRTIPIGFKGIGLWLEKRVASEIYPEGLVWNWPTPFGDINFIDIRNKPIDLPLTEVLTKDRVPVSINVALQTKITDLFKYLDAHSPEESLRNAAESDIRFMTAQHASDEISNETLSADVTRSLKEDTPLEDVLLKGLHESIDQWGITVSQVRITSIRLPKNIEDANTETQVQVANQKKEMAQAVAEKTEAKHIAAMMAIYKEAGLSPSEAMNMLQTERGKATRIILDGRADSLVQAGALAGGLFGQTKPQPSPPAGQRRRNNS